MNIWQSLYRSIAHRFSCAPLPIRDPTPQRPEDIESTTSYLPAQSAQPADAILLEAKSLIERSAKKQIKLNAQEFINRLKKNKVSDDTLYVIKDDLFLNNDYTLPDFTGNLYVNGSFTLALCPQLSDVPGNIVVTKSFVVMSCQSLTDISGKITAGKHIQFDQCRNLRTLSGNLSSRDNFYLLDCSCLRSLPGTISPGGHIFIDQCTALTALPDWITTLGPTLSGSVRAVVLRNSVLSDRLIERLHNVEAPGMRFLVRRPSAQAQQLFNNFPEAFDFWRKLAACDAATPALNLLPYQLRELVIFLEKLTTTADYNNLISRTALAQRVIHTLLSVLGNEQIQTSALTLIHDAISSCGDRVILALEDLETLTLQAVAAELAVNHEDPSELIALGRKMMLVEKVKHIAQTHADSLLWVDEVEVVLAYQIELRKHLELPGATERMLYRPCAQVSDENINEALVQLRRSCTERELAEFLKVWTPWQTYQRHLAIPRFDQLPLQSVDHIRECPIDREIKVEMVMLNNTHMTYQALCSAYRLNGNNPLTNSPLDWSAVVRLTKDLGDNSATTKIQPCVNAQKPLPALQS